MKENPVLDMAGRGDGWMRTILTGAAVYHIAVGAWIALFPATVLRWLNVTPPDLWVFWQSVGGLLAAFGVGYALARRDPTRHWPIVLVGLLTKAFGIIGFLAATTADRIPWSFGLVIVLNDLLWLPPFAMILHAVFTDWRLERDRQVYELAAPVLLDTARTSTGQTLAELSRQGPLLLVFLRQAGCIFCREAISDLARERETLTALGARLALVHMEEPQSGTRVFARFGLDDVPNVSDPERTLYRAFKLRRGEWRQLVGPVVLRRGLQAARAGHRPGAPAGDWFQLPGAFLLRNGQIMREFRHETAAARPDYVEFVCGQSNDDHSE